MHRKNKPPIWEHGSSVRHSRDRTRLPNSKVMGGIVITVRGPSDPRGSELRLSFELITSIWSTEKHTLLRPFGTPCTASLGIAVFQLEFSRDPDVLMVPGESLPPTNDSEPMIRDALVVQLGLKLIPIKVPQDEIVIDPVEKPSAN